MTRLKDWRCFWYKSSARLVVFIIIDISIVTNKMIEDDADDTSEWIVVETITYLPTRLVGRAARNNSLINTLLSKTTFARSIYTRVSLWSNGLEKKINKFFPLFCVAGSGTREMKPTECWHWTTNHAISVHTMVSTKNRHSIHRKCFMLIGHNFRRSRRL